jgi:hypothetical protein
MMKLALSCIWICLVTAASSYVVASWKMNHGETEVSSKVTSGNVETRKTSTLNVPMIRNGNVEGYIVIQFAYTIDQANLNSLGLSADVFILDEAFRSLFSDEIDLGHLEKYSLTGLTKNLKTTVNQRLGGDPVKDILIDQFNFIPKQEIRK